MEEPHRKKEEREEREMSHRVDAWRTPIEMAAQEKKGHRERGDEVGIKTLEVKGS